LPHLYYGLVGPSAIVRSYCATAFGEATHATRENVPPLVFEAFALLLSDSFIVVHTAAARALQRFQLPETLRGEAAASLLNLIRYYAKRKEDWHFVVDCIDTLSYELHRTGTAKGKIGRYLVKVLLEAETIWVKSEIRSFARTLGETEGFADLVIRLLPEVDDDSRRGEEVLDALESLQAEIVFERRAEFERVGKELAPRRPWIACHVIEALGRGGAWAEARRVAEAGVEGHPATAENRSRRIYSQSLLIAARLEEAVADGRGGESAIFQREWQENKREQQEQDDDVRRRNSRSGFSHPG
jgi:hypothetical protein